MRKRLFIFAAATCFALSAFATPAFAEEPNLPDEQTIGSEAHDGNEDGLLNGSDDGPTDDSSTVGGEQEKDNGNATPGANHDPVADGSAGSVMTLAGTSAVQNVQAWIDTNPAASTGRATFTLDGDFTTDQGLLFTGDSTAPADNRQTFIIDAQSHNITLNGYGIGATYCNVIIKDCNTLTIKAHRHPVSGVFDSACYFWHATLKLSNCTNVTIENDEKDQRASGISVYDEGSLYFDNKTNVAISGYMANNCSGIYMDRDDYDKIMGSINVNADTKGYIFDIIKLEPGAKWSVLDDDGKIIDDWYHDDEGKDNRWKPETAKNNTDTVLPLGAALKAAHGINAPTPSPMPATPKPAEPTAAPTVAPTAAPADNTATAAPAAPAPTARPAVTATPAPTAQASGVIPQTGDSSSPALFSILALGSITALCVLQKRRKSK